MLRVYCFSLKSISWMLLMYTPTVTVSGFVLVSANSCCKLQKRKRMSHFFMRLNYGKRGIVVVVWEGKKFYKGLAFDRTRTDSFGPTFAPSARSAEESLVVMY